MLEEATRAINRNWMQSKSEPQRRINLMQSSESWQGSKASFRWQRVVVVGKYSLPTLSTELK